MGVAFVMKHVVTETKVIRLCYSTVKVVSFTERAARGPQLEKMHYEISNISILARFQDFKSKFQYLKSFHFGKKSDSIDQTIDIHLK